LLFPSPGRGITAAGQRLVLPFLNSNAPTTRSQNHTCRRFWLTHWNPTSILPSPSLKLTRWPRKRIPHPPAPADSQSRPDRRALSRL